MLDALKSLFENNVITEQMRSEIEEAWQAKVKENRLAATAELREEFAQKYEHDKSVMAESVATMLEERLASELAELHEDRKSLAEARARFAIAMRENSNLMKSFVMESLKKEITELHEDQKAMATKFGLLEDFIVEQLAKEIAEFQEDKKDLAETKVRLVREAKSHVARVKEQFIKRSAALVAETVEKGLKSEISQLKEDIDQARKNDFGRRLFESFAAEYMGSHLNEKSEASKLLKVIEIKDRQLSEAKAFAVKAKQLAESKDAENKRLVESVSREKKLNELLAPLGRDQKEIMKDLLESVQTNRLQAAFEKYLPAVIDGKSPAKQTKAIITEGKEITGNRENNTKSTADTNVIDIKRLAGLN
jgi:hypothetical protein